MSKPRVSEPGWFARSFERHLRAENKSDRTLETYLDAVRQLESFLAERGLGIDEAEREDIEAFLGRLLERWKPATAANRYRALRVLYRSLGEEGEIPADPMAKMRPPKILEQPVAVLGDDALRRLLATCGGKDFEARRDTAAIMLLIDAGPRRAEMVLGGGLPRGF